MKIFCAAMPGPGHAHPMLAVARALANRGHEVLFSSSPDHDEDARAAGCTPVTLPLTPGSPLGALRPYDDSEELARACAPLLARLEPDVVVADLLTLGVALAAEVNDIPYASLVIHGLHTPSADLLPFGFGAAPGRGLRAIRDRALRRAHARDLAAANAQLNITRARLGLSPARRVDATLSPDLQLVATLPSLEIPRSDWPEVAHVVGPCLWDPPGAMPPIPGGDGPLVLIAPSTAWPAHDFVRASLIAVERAGARAVITLGKSDLPARLPGNVVSAPFASHEGLLPHCSAVICNGGHGVVARTLTHGVPVVVLPGHGDQRENGYRVARTGAGLRVLRGSLVPAALGRILREPSFRTAAQRIADEAAGLDGPATASTLVEGLVRRYADDAGR